MRLLNAAVVALCCSPAQALAWGQEGHSIVAEIAQRRLKPPASDRVQALLKNGSLASVASWPDDVRGARPKTYNWHFVDIPLAAETYDPSRDCELNLEKGDCAIAELVRLKRDLVCADTDALKAEALKFTVHFIGDIHQPMHTVLEKVGGNFFDVEVFMRGMTCTGKCKPDRSASNLHEVWDSGLILKTVWDWGAYVDRLEGGWLKSPEPNADAGNPQDWVEETHKAARAMWNAVPADATLTDDYYNQALPVLDRQLAVGGLRLAKFLNDAYAVTSCNP